MRVEAPDTPATKQAEYDRDLEPDVRERKHYAPGVGLVLEVDLDTKERGVGEDHQLIGEIRSWLRGLRRASARAFL